MGELVLRFVEGTARVRTEDISYIESYRHRIVFHTTEGEYSIYKPLAEIEEMLDADGFMRVHKSYIVGMRYVKTLTGHELTLKDGTVLPIPKGRYKEVRERFMGYKG